MASKFTAGPTGQLTDETLAAQIAQGDVSALEALYERHAAMVMGITLKVTGDRTLAENVLEETFWQVWKSAAAYQPQSGPFTGWLFRMARQIAMDASAKAAADRMIALPQVLRLFRVHALARFPAAPDGYPERPSPRPRMRATRSLLGQFQSRRPPEAIDRCPRSRT